MLYNEDLRFLKSKGMSRSKFMRQAIEAFNAGKWDYRFLEEKDES